MSPRSDSGPHGLLVAVVVALLLLTLLMRDGVLRYAVCAVIVVGHFFTMVPIARRHGHDFRWR